MLAKFFVMRTVCGYGRPWDRSYYIKLIPYVAMADYGIDHTILSLYHMWLWQTIG